MSLVSKAALTISFLLFSLLILVISSLPDRNLHVIFCDVGQGDAILVTYGTTQILIDGGPDNKVLSCLSRHIPFWDRGVEVLIVTHPQLDHFGGFIDVLRRYEVELVLKPEVEGEIIEWDEFKQEMTKHSAIEGHYVMAGQSIRYSKLSFDIFNPVQGCVGTDLNEYSIVGNLSFGEFDILLTGDIGPPVVDYIDNIKPVEVLKVPHHGSKNGLTEDLLKKSSPKLAVISLGKKNRYGHPHEEVLEMLGEANVKVLRTDIEGEIEIVSDGKKWWVLD